MKLFELHKVFEFSLPYISSFDLIRLKYNKLFNQFDFTTGTDCDTITFKNKQLKADGSGRYEAFKVLREGSVSINSEVSNLIVSWSVRLDTLYFLSLLITFAATIIVYILLRPQALMLLITGMCALGCSFGIGYLYILNKIDEINITCLEQ